VSGEQQLAHYEKVLPVLLRSPIGWISWGLVVSHDFDPFTDIVYPDGHPRRSISRAADQESTAGSQGVT